MFATPAALRTTGGQSGYHAMWIAQRTRVAAGPTAIAGMSSDEAQTNTQLSIETRQKSFRHAVSFASGNTILRRGIPRDAAMFLVLEQRIFQTDSGRSRCVLRLANSYPPGINQWNAVCCLHMSRSLHAGIEGDDFSRSRRTRISARRPTRRGRAPESGNLNIEAKWLRLGRQSKYHLSRHCP